MDKNSLITDHLRVVLGDDVSREIIDYLTAMKDVEDYDEFMSNIVNWENKHHKTAYEYIKTVLFRENTKKANNRGKDKSRANAGSNSDTASRKQTDANAKNATTKGKKKFQDIHTFKEKTKEKVGRHECDCEGQEHDFMNNCLNCGRIHCTEEGPGPCFFCKEPVTLMGAENTSRKQQQKQGGAGGGGGSGGGSGGGGGSMLRHKENKVFDDDNDYFKANLQKKRAKDGKRDRVIALDFATRKVIESSEEDEKIRQKLLEDSMVHLKTVEKMFKNIQQSFEVRNIAKQQNDLVELLVQMRHRKPTAGGAHQQQKGKKGEEEEEEEEKEEDSAMPIIDYKRKVYDEERMANEDQGLCLTLHQPYASLLVAGVKRHEGRTWCTAHRGRLWIAAAAKEPDEDEIEELEKFYRTYYDDPGLKFPKQYPTSCLLGCVFVEDCLDQETYRQQYPEGESSSPYILICSSPIILPIFYPMAGKHKIYALDGDLHRTAKISLRYARYIS